MKRAAEHRQNNHVGVPSAVPSGQTSSFGRVIIALAGCVVISASLSACMSGPVPGAATPSPASSDGAVPTPQPAGEDPATAAVKQTVTDALNRLAAGNPKPATAQVTESLTGAGVPAAALEVSESRTPTGLEADAIEAAVLQGKDCVVGQIRDGGVTVTVLPVLASGKCFVGSAS